MLINVVSKLMGLSSVMTNDGDNRLACGEEFRCARAHARSIGGINSYIRTFIHEIMMVVNVLQHDLEELGYFCLGILPVVLS